MDAKTPMSACEKFTVRHFSGLGAMFLAVLLIAAGCGVMRGWQADSAQQLFGHQAIALSTSKS